MPESSADDDGSYFDFDIDHFAEFDNVNHDIEDDNNDHIDLHDASCQPHSINEDMRTVRPRWPLRPLPYTIVACNNY
jgi:hypothetical protein